MCVLAGFVDGDFNQIANDLFHIATDIADFGEFCCFDFDEGRLCEPREPARDFGFSNARRANHQNVFGLHLLAQLIRQLLTPPAVSQGAYVNTKRSGKFKAFKQSDLTS